MPTWYSVESFDPTATISSSPYTRWHPIGGDPAWPVDFTNPITDREAAEKLLQKQRGNGLRGARYRLVRYPEPPRMGNPAWDSKWIRPAEIGLHRTPRDFPQPRDPSWQRLTMQPNRPPTFDELVRVLAQNVEDTKEAARRAQLDLDEMLSYTQIECAYCKRSFCINELVYIQTHWYVQPYSCNEGDYWKEDRGEFDCIACLRRNRLSDRETGMKLKYLFKGVTDEYEH